MRYFLGEEFCCDDLMATYRATPVRVEIYYFPMELQLFVNRPEGTEFHTYGSDGDSSYMRITTDFPCEELAVRQILPALSDHLRSRQKDAYIPMLELYANL